MANDGPRRGMWVDIGGDTTTVRTDDDARWVAEAGVTLAYIVNNMRSGAIKSYDVDVGPFRALVTAEPGDAIAIRLKPRAE
ncbi:MAG: hypothetical protein FJ318_09045 [SAR202 cluster bacterium]|nr:hypothetical protein [SAR202 cluster bacterium]